MNQEQEVAKILVSALDRGTSSLDEVTLGRLAAARKKAIAAMPVQATEVEPVLAGVAKHFAFYLHGQRLWVSMLVLLSTTLIVIALMHAGGIWEPLEADALLLGSDLPPEAYLDKGFDTWLEQSSQR